MGGNPDHWPGGRAAEQAIAVVGASCRLPGGIHDLGGLWTALSQGRDLITQVPPDRFDATRFVDASMPRPGKSYTAAGGFLEDVTGFDAAYFGISPREAAQMDPQHRLLLELAVEAFDDAAIDPASTAGSDTAVFIGISDASYGMLQMGTPRSVNAYTMSGMASSIAANRLSHFLDLRGPSMAVDTACSSSLVAVAQACRTLLDGTSALAVAGGVNALVNPHTYVGFSQASMLSPTGRCRPFSAGADGYVRAEGGGVVLLKRLADALAAGDRVHAVIAGSGVNNDGRTRGIALPNSAAQEALLRDVYRRAGVDPDDIVYVEAHGTGTPVGDPAECRAVGRALARRRTAGELPIGSVKSNIGHLEPASGMPGLFKALLVLRHGVIPATLHTTPPHPDIDFTGLRLAPVGAPLPVAVGERSVVGVNSFGFGGANAHVIVAPPPALPEPDEAAPPGVRPVIVSARSEAALQDAVDRTVAGLRTARPDAFYDLAHTACRRRALHEHRAVVLADDTQQAADRLAALVGDVPPGAAGLPVAVGRTGAHGHIAFVFSGNGTQYAGMAADLLAEDPVFREAVAEADAVLEPLLGWSVQAELSDPADRPRLAATEVAQPLLFTVQVGLLAALRAAGVDPSAVVGHSVGEIAAAYAAGALTLADAALVVAVRSRTQALTQGTGRMAAVALPPERAGELARCHPGLGIACVNSDHDVTVSGPVAALDAFLAELSTRGVPHRDLALDHPFHSPAMDHIKEPLLEGLARLAPPGADPSMVSTVTGAPLEAGAVLDAAYWWRNVREPVLFAPAIDHVVREGCDVLVEVGPRPALQRYLRRAAAKVPTSVAVVPTLVPGTTGRAALGATTAAVIAAGAQVDWSDWFPRRGRVSALPAYPWQRERHWCGTPDAWLPPQGGDRRLDHPLLGERLPSPEPSWRGPVEPVLVPWLADHQVGGSVVMPATGYLEMALAAGHRVLGTAVEVHHLEITGPLVVPWDDPGEVALSLVLHQSGGLFRIAAAREAAGRPDDHARGRVRTLVGRRAGPVDVDAVRARCERPVTAEAHYSTLADAGLHYGPSFRVLREVHAGSGEVLAAYRLQADDAPYEVHPALLDGALQAGAALLNGTAGGTSAYLPVKFDSVRIWRRPGVTGLIHVRERSRTAVEARWDLVVTDEDGTVVAELDGCRLRRFDNPHRTPLTCEHTVLRAAPHLTAPAAPSPLPGPAPIMRAAEGAVAALRTSPQGVYASQALQPFKTAMAGAQARAIAEALADPRAPFTLADLVAAGLQERHIRLVVRGIVPTLERHGLLERVENERWRLTGTGTAGTGYGAALVRDHPGFMEVVLGCHHTQHLDEILLGRLDPMDLLSAEGTEGLEQFYDVAPVNRFHNRIAQILMRDVADRWPGDRPLRVLEVGAGTGGLTAALLPVLPPERTHYTFTDVSPVFFLRARQRFADYGFVDYRTFDLDADPGAQGFPDGGHDLVVAANALHTAADLTATARRLARLLAPGGLLLAVEAHDPELVTPLFGALDSFWAFTDHALRTDSPLLPAHAWQAVLHDAGFTDVHRTGGEAPSDEPAFSVFLAATGRGPLARPALPPAGEETVWIVAHEAGTPADLAGAVAGLLSAPGVTVHQMEAGADPQEWSRFAPSDAPAVGIVLILGDAGEDGQGTADAPDAAVGRTTRRAAALRRIALACERLPGTVRTSLWLVTRPSGALPAPEEPLEPVDAAAWGVARTLGNEHPRLAIRRVSLERTEDVAADADLLARELTAPSDEDEIVLTAGGRFVPRVVALPAPSADRTEAGPFGLEVRDVGMSYRLAWREHDALPSPGPGQVAIEVRAAALNYHDPLHVTGLLPPEADEGTFAENRLGMECAGLVTATGPDVTGIAVGDRVFALAPHSLGSHVVTSVHAVGRMPDGMTFEGAATLPVAFLTVHYSLSTVARLAPGETLLVHSAAGGIGLAALQYAQEAGARVIATVGTRTKRDLLRWMGVEHVLDSHSLAFVPEVMDITGGRGVDVVLNSLAGDAMARSLELVAPGGRFVELGKRDILENNALPLRPFHNSIVFAGVNLLRFLHDLELAKAHFEEVSALIRAGRYRPLLHSVYPAARVSEAFRLMQHSKHVGKVVISLDPSDDPVRVERRPAAPSLDPDATYLVTGGLGGFGAATARWLADRGARHLALTGRRGRAAPEADALLRDLAERGVRATPHAADVTDLAAMRRVRDEARAGGHPVRGIIHSAMHLDDGLLTELPDDRWAAAVAPKLAGATVLDALADDEDLHLFVLYSSLAATVGHIRQSNYVAGNLFLEALARRRRHRGAPGLAVGWGALGDVGYIARTGIIPLLERVGMEPVAPAEALSTLGTLLLGDPGAACAGRFDFARLQGILPTLGKPRLAGLLPPRLEGSGNSREELLKALAGRTTAERLEVIANTLAQLCAQVLHLPADRIDHHRKLDEYGMDSLTGAELLTSLRRRFDLDIPPMEIIRSGGTVADLSRVALLRLGLGETEASAGPGPAPTANP